MEYNPHFWEKIGTALRDLRLLDCFLTVGVLRSVLRQCPKLESFVFSGEWLPVFRGVTDSPSSLHLLRWDGAIFSQTPSTRPKILARIREGRIHCTLRR